MARWPLTVVPVAWRSRRSTTGSRACRCPRPEDFPDRAVPDDGTRLADFIHKRLFDSFATWSARQFLTWSLAEDHPTWSSPGVTRLTADELPPGPAQHRRRPPGGARPGRRPLPGG